MWNGVGGVWNHSTSFGIASVLIIPRWTAIASHIIRIKYSNAMKDIIDPIEDSMFQ